MFDSQNILGMLFLGYDYIPESFIWLSYSLAVISIFNVSIILVFACIFVLWNILLILLVMWEPLENLTMGEPEANIS